MSLYCLSTPPALVAAYTATPGVLTGYVAPAQLGVANYKLTMSSDAWVAQGIPDTVVTVDHTTEIWTATGHNLLPGMPVQISNSGGALPTGVSAATSYFANPIDANTFFLYDTYAHAIAGGATGKLSPSTNGTGTQTATTVATKSAGSAFIPRRIPVDVDGALGAKISVIQDSAGGNASLWPEIGSR